MADNGILKFFKGVSNEKGAKFGTANPRNYRALYAAGEISEAEYEYWKKKEAELAKQ